MFQWIDLAHTKDVRSGILTLQPGTGTALSALELHVVHMDSGVIAFWTTKRQEFTFEVAPGIA